MGGGRGVGTLEEYVGVSKKKIGSRAVGPKKKKKRPSKKMRAREKKKAEEKTLLTK